MAETPSTGPRIAMIDTARFYGMILVYYGHIVEQVMYLDSAAAAAQYKCIYSFHMPLFFLISGTIASERKLSFKIWPFLKQLLASRLLPYFLFSLLLCGVSLFVSGRFPMGELNGVDAYVKGWVSTFLGFPSFCLPLWFMALLVSVEIVHYLVSRLVKQAWGLGVLALLLYMGGYYLNEAYYFVGKGTLFWFLNEVPVVWAFYAVGVLLRRSGMLERDWPRLPLALGALACLALVWLTYDLNTGPFRIIQAVVIVLSGHGHVFWFPMTALVGCAAVLFLARSGPSWSWLTFMGRNALSLFCLNGVFYHFVNPPMAAWFAQNYSTSHGPVFAYGLMMTVASLALCVPATLFLTGKLPQLMGKPHQNGPWLRAVLKG